MYAQKTDNNKNKMSIVHTETTNIRKSAVAERSVQTGKPTHHH